MKQIYAFALTGAVLSSASAASAQAACKPEFVQLAQTVSIPNIQVSAGASTAETFQIRVRNDGDASAQCPAVLRVAYLSTSPSSNMIEYSLQAKGTKLEILASETLPGTSASDLMISQLPPGPNGVSIPFRLNIASGWGLASGSQVNDLIVSLLDETGAVVDTMNLTISLTVPPAVEVRVVGVTGQSEIASINLGILDPLTTTTSDPFGVRVWSTSPYTVSFRSENEGRLMHSARADTIDYQLFMDGREVSTLGMTAAFVSSGTDALGNLHPTGVRVEPFRARAGNYSDRVEVTVTAN